MLSQWRRGPKYANLFRLILDCVGEQIEKPMHPESIRLMIFISITLELFLYLLKDAAIGAILTAGEHIAKHEHSQILEVDRT
jgi:hypothetical protein